MLNLDDGIFCDRPPGFWSANVFETDNVLYNEVVKYLVEVIVGFKLEMGLHPGRWDYTKDQL